MLFSSLVFIFYFLPVALALYYLSPKKWRNGMLLFISIVFYSWGGLGNMLLLFASISVNFLIAKRIERNAARAKQWLITGIVLNTSLLVSFKYSHFFLNSFYSLGELFGGPAHIPLPTVLPILGISFYTFHQMSMLRDIYRDRTLPKVSFQRMSLYVLFFPQLVAGPIVRYKDIIYQIHARKETMDQVYAGVQRFIVGLFKKVAIANSCALLADMILSEDVANLSTGATWLGIAAYTLQIYFDFSGYSDMAIGLAKLFGFNLLENFNLPYTAHSIKDFWRRWHISLSTWFRDYVYIPLGGSHKGKMRTYVNLMGVFLLTGFWHGAAWTFIFWGLFHGLFLLIERWGWDKVLNRLPGIVGWAYTMLIVMIGWVFFRLDNFRAACNYVLHLFHSTGRPMKDAWYFLDNRLVLVLIVGIVCSTIDFRKWTDRLRISPYLDTFPVEFVRNSVYLLLFCYSVMLLTSSSYNPFIYFNF